MAAGKFARAGVLAPLALLTFLIAAALVVIASIILDKIIDNEPNEQGGHHCVQCIWHLQQQVSARWSMLGSELVELELVLRPIGGRGHPSSCMPVVGTYLSRFLARASRLPPRGSSTEHSSDTCVLCHHLESLLKQRVASRGLLAA